MPMLEQGLSKLYWPPLVKQAVMTIAHPGYRYELFTNFKELDEYFTKECGSDWRKSEWARFWFNQHQASKLADRKELNPEKSFQGPRRDMPEVEKACIEILEQSPYISSRKLVFILNAQKGVAISHTTASKIIKRFKEESGNG